MPTRRYAAGTTVSSDRSLAEIAKLVKGAGGTNWSHAELDDEEPPRAYVQFKMGGWVLRFVLTLPTAADVAYTTGGRYRPVEQRREALRQETQRRWRELVFLLKAKLVAIESGVVSLDQEMMPYILLTGDETAADYVLPRLKELRAAAEGDGDVRLLPPAVIIEEN